MFTEPVTALPPEPYLARRGTIFTRFDRQDSGNVSYGVEAGDSRYFVKTAGSREPGPVLAFADRVRLLRNAIRLARAYRHPALPALRHVVESPGGPMLVYDWAPGELLYTARERRDDPDSAYRRFRALPVARVLACLDAIVDVHDLLGRGGEVAADFYDGCLIYDFTAHRVSLIDLDMYQPGPLRNERGRVFGSTRFTAPEEFTLGAVLDQRTSVFTLGRTVLVLLSDPAGAFRGPAPLLAVASRACEVDPARRYPSLPEFCAAWRRAR
jgi:serine/threonine-protein kinase